MWAHDLPASDGRWWAQGYVINPHVFEVTYRVTNVYPLATAPCPACTLGESPVVTLEPGGVRELQPPSILPGQRLVAGSLELETSAPVNIHFVAIREGGTAVRQRLDVARGWLEAGAHRVSTAEFTASGRMNVFVTNPSDTTLDVAMWMMSRDENEVRVSVAPRTTRVVTLPTPRCGGAPCTFPAVFPPPPLRVDFEANGRFLATVSSVTPTWAVFSLPDSVSPE